MVIARCGDVFGLKTVLPEVCGIGQRLPVKEVGLGRPTARIDGARATGVKPWGSSLSPPSLLGGYRSATGMAMWLDVKHP
ncbi:MAG: hypothetical protein Ct9H300mP16_10050 [Pseudomonadota bacterium]|nr:MAG: hypothetical protein Ct9H300mP16_10050 [Pseudomonadota bacterium]